MATVQPVIVCEEVQPSLFAPGELPDNPKLAVAAKSFFHTGKITCKDEERAAAIAQAFLECGNYLPVARRYHVSPNTVHAVVEVMEREGKLEGLKQRVSRKLGLLAEVSCEAAIDMVYQGKTPANVLPINTGVAWDKRALIEGEPTAVVANVAAVRVELDDVVSFLRLKGIEAPAIDIASTAMPPEPKETP